MASSKFNLNKNGIPNFEDLPLGKGDPPYSAWGLYGKDDGLGTLNRLTDERVADAAKNEIKTGVRVSLNWEMDAQSKGTFFDRQLFHQNLFKKPERCVNDDVWTFNTQASSQWDGLRHFAYQKEQRFYNGVTMEDIHASGADKSLANGVQIWAERGIVGRGILVDYHSWRLEQGKGIDCFETTPIPLSDLQACLAAQGTEVKFGDILIIRSGWQLARSAKTDEQMAAYQAVSPPHFVGIERSPALLRWLWDNFSAAAGDHPTLEAWPAPHSDPWSLHEVLLSGWGCPIGELFHLEALAAECRRQRRWSFFVTSEPCNVPGGVASPPNILAIF